MDFIINYPIEFAIAVIGAVVIIIFIITCFLVNKTKKNKKVINKKLAPQVITNTDNISKLQKDVRCLEDYVYDDYITEIKDVNEKHKALKAYKKMELLERQLHNELELDKDKGE